MSNPSSTDAALSATASESCAPNVLLLLKCSDLALRGQQQLCLLDRQLHVLDRGVLLALSLSFFRQGCDAGVAPYIARLSRPRQLRRARGIMHPAACLALSLSLLP